MKQLGFMALLTLILLVSVQSVSVWALIAENLSFDDYLRIWVPLLTLAVGFWFGQQRQPVMKATIALVITALLVGAGVGWYFTKPVPVVETAAPEIKQPDGSVVAERRPDAKAKPKHQTPRGAKVERVMTVKAQGGGIKMPDGEVHPCPPVTIDMSLVRMPDNTRRVIASSPDGEIVSALDIPVETAAPPEEPKKWAAGVSYSPSNNTSGLWVERDIGRLRAGLDINQTRQHISAPSGIEARVRLGWTF